MTCSFECVYEMVYHDCSESGCSDCEHFLRCDSCVFFGSCSSFSKFEHIRRLSVASQMGCPIGSDCGKCDNTKCPNVLPFQGVIYLFVLCACECSQIVTAAFRAAGHQAFSSDIELAYGDMPEYHIFGDVSRLLQPGPITFKTMAGIYYTVPRWDLIIAFPPCTYLTAASAVRLYVDGQINLDRYNLGLKAKDFFMMFYNVDCDCVCIENPLPLKIFELPKYDQIVHPYFFGDGYYKRTCLWLRGLPLLQPTNIVEPVAHWVNAKSGSVGLHNSQRKRSQFHPGMAAAMAAQWG